MKSMTCKQLGGACGQVFKADTFEEIAEKSKAHGMEMSRNGDDKHLEATNAMNRLMSVDGVMDKWIEERRREFDALPECE